MLPSLPEIPNPVADAVTGAIDAAFLGFFSASQELIKFAFKAADNQSVFSLTADPDGSTPSLVVGQLWPITMGLGVMMALTLLSWQVVSALVRGRGGVEVGRSLVGIAQFALATGAVIVVAQTVNLACDAISIAILDAGLEHATFKAAGQDLFQTVETGMASVLMLVFGIVGILGAIVLWIEFAFRQLAVIALVVAAPIAAAGLVSGTTRAWFPTMAKWTLAALASKPAIALVLVIGVKMLSGGEGLAALLAGTTALVVATMMPWAMLRLFSFVEAGGSGRGAGHQAVVGAGGYAAGTATGRSRSGGPAPAGSDGPAPAGGSATETATSSRLAGAGAGGGSGAGGGGSASGPWRSAAGLAAAGARRAHAAGAYLADGFGDYLDKDRTGDPDYRGASGHLHDRPRARPHHGGGPLNFPPPAQGGGTGPGAGAGAGPGPAGGTGPGPGGGAAAAPPAPPPAVVVP